MRVLWLTNVPLPEASLLLKKEPTPFGGWLVNASKYLSDQDNVKLGVSFPEGGNPEVVQLSGEKIDFFGFTPVKDMSMNAIKDNKNLEKILNIYKPDIVHIFGTEYTHCLSMVNSCNKFRIKVVISIQGLVSIYALHYMANLPASVQRGFTFRDLLKQDNLKQQQRKFVRRGIFEMEALKDVTNVIGRTTWDKACTFQINSSLKYFHCNEILRDEFYKYTWNLGTCERQSIFLSQGSYPIKGLHFMLDAMPEIIKNFPNTKLYIGGNDITQSKTLMQKAKISSYGKYIKNLINKYNIQDKVIFTGILDEKEMCHRYLKSNVFVCPSSIENSPNSLGEAMILGVPTVASDVGGISDLLETRKEGFIYQTDASYMLAHYICEIFGNDEVALEISKNSRERAQKTHDRSANTKKLIEIYHSILVNNDNDKNEQ